MAGLPYEPLQIVPKILYNGATALDQLGEPVDILDFINPCRRRAVGGFQRPQPDSLRGRMARWLSSEAQPWS